ncbi:MAG: hypothetical protein ACJAWL_000192 [Motiliproteus sp.]|jgi:hypothetical protein
MKSSLRLTDSNSLGTSLYLTLRAACGCANRQIGNPADLSASAASLAIACRDASMPLLSETDSGQWLDPAGLFQSVFYRFRKGVWRHFDCVIAVPGLSKSVSITHKTQP